jgi:hypothetical protein
MDPGRTKQEKVSVGVPKTKKRSTDRAAIAAGAGGAGEYYHTVLVPSYCPLDSLLLTIVW